MRRKNREITEFNEIVEILRQCDVCRLALNDEEYPYIIPLNYGLEIIDGKVRMIFHSAMEGYKVELIKRDNRACFEVDCKHELQYFEDKGYCTMAYESVIGKGKIHILSDEEKFEALTRLMEHYHPGMNAPFNTEAMARTLVYVLEVESLTGKRKLPK